MQDLSSPYPSVTTPRAVEVVGMLGDSIVTVDHLEPADRAPSKTSARWVLGAGALMLVVSAFAFAKGVASAAANKEAFEAFRETGRAAYEFRPTTLPIGYDYLAFGGLFGGLLAIAFGLLGLRAARAKSSFVLGTAADADFSTSDAPAEQFPLVTERAGELMVNITGGMSATLCNDGAVFPLARPADSSFTTPSATVPGAYEVSLPAAGSVRLSAGPASFVIRSVPANAARVDGFLGGFDRQAMRFFGASAIAHVAIVALLATIPPSPKSLALDLGTRGVRNTRSAFTPKEQPINRDKTGGDKNAGASSTGAASASAGAMGKAGRPDSQRDKGRRAIKNNSHDKHLARKIALAQARDVGIAGVLRRTSASFQDLSSASDFTSGYDEYDEVGGYDGAEGSEYGTWGNGRDGNGPGAGGPGGLHYTGNYNTIPGGGWPGPGGPGGTGGPRLRKHKSEGPRVKDIRPIVQGGLDKSIVRRYVRRKLDRIRYCYDRALLANARLRGTVKVTFVIANNGAVISSNGSGMNSAMNSCVAAIVKRVRFPRTDGGMVTVAYPFNFTSN